MRLTKVNPLDNQLGQRCWWYQCCSQLAYWQIAPQDNPLRSKYITLEWHRKKCQDVFDSPLWPDTNAIIAEFGGDQPHATNVFYSNGGNDPWQWAGVRATLDAKQPAHVIQGDSNHDCGHCIDLHDSKDDDPQDLGQHHEPGHVPS